MPKNWITTAFGWGAAICLIGYKLFTNQPLTAADVVTAAGLAGVGTAAKDVNVHSTVAQTQQATTDAAVSKPAA